MNIFCIGLPNSGGEYITKLFDNSENFKVLKKRFDYNINDKVFKILNKYTEQTFSYCPEFLFNKNKLEQLLDRIQINDNRNIILICLREFNEIINQADSLKSFLKNKYIDDTKYYNLFDNILYLKDRIEQMNNCELRVLKYLDIVNYSTIYKFDKINITVDVIKFPKKDFKINFKQFVDIKNKLFNEYFKVNMILNNNIIK